MDDLRDLYQEVILDHGKNPRNFRHPEDANRHAEGDNPLCGDRLTVYLKMGHNGLVEDVAFEGRGCAISMASASMMTEIVAGKTEQEARALFRRFHDFVTGREEIGEADNDDLEKLIVLAGVKQFPMRVKCATLAWHTMTAAMDGQDAVTTE
ncbi:MAG: SUF system NifU family Fe-S cluster assembly protein [Proteobacteria bacterium]|jgi:nitrogen fixation protein NifU and related proteins|nr:SUF system NifU family Fe-S cluster assembly protein [Pseudomonadota bacterium]MDA0952093.1 SUF system NifU family Fe-S cluster assembly protein [Pseudomonadota bacterium]MDA1072749.1 SUF system NifU family Fe-S cluster assembly protein [Pseudomonadota bacterium]